VSSGRVTADRHPRLGLAAGNTHFMVEPMSNSVSDVVLPRLAHLLGEGEVLPSGGSGGSRSGLAREA